MQKKKDLAKVLSNAITAAMILSPATALAAQNVATLDNPNSGAITVEHPSDAVQYDGTNNVKGTGAKQAAHSAQENVVLGPNAQVAVYSGSDNASFDTVVGHDAKVTGTSGTAIGTAAKVDAVFGGSAFGTAATVQNGQMGTATGFMTDAEGNFATANGANATAKGAKTSALGANTKASAENATAVGAGATATAKNSIAIGADSVADEADTVSVGKTSATRKIANVTAGVKGTDAVNVDQLNKAKSDLTNDYTTKIANAKTELTNDYTTKINNAKTELNTKIDNTKTELTNDYTTKISNAKTELQNDYNAKLNNKANVGLNNITDGGKQVIRDIAKNAVNINSSSGAVTVKKTLDNSGVSFDLNLNKDQSFNKVDVGTLNVTGNSVIGTNKNNTMTVNATTNLKGDTTVDGKAVFNQGVTVNGNTQTKTLNVTGSSTIGTSKADTMTVNATTNLKNDVTVGGKTTLNDVTVNGGATFGGNVTFSKGLNVNNQKITNVAAGTAGTDAVNVDQLNKTKTEIQNDYNTKLDKKANIDLDNITEKGKDVIRSLASTKVDIQSSTGAVTVKKTTGADGKVDFDLGLNKDQTFNKVGIDTLNISHNTVVGTSKTDTMTVNATTNLKGDTTMNNVTVNGKATFSKGLDVSNQKITSVAAGVIAQDSTDAVNGGQLYQAMRDTRKGIKDDIDKATGEVGAQAAAMSSLHPLEYDQDHRVSVAASVGAYKDQTAGAVGAFYRPDDMSMVSLQGSFGHNDNMYGLGFSQKFGHAHDGQKLDSMSDVKDAMDKLRAENEDLKAKYEQIMKMLSERTSLPVKVVSEVVTTGPRGDVDDVDAPNGTVRNEVDNMLRMDYTGESHSEGVSAGVLHSDGYTDGKTAPKTDGNSYSVGFAMK